MKSTRDTSSAPPEAMMWFGGVVIALSFVTYSFQLIYTGLDSMFTAQPGASAGGVGLAFMAFTGVVLLSIGLGWSRLINQRDHKTNEALTAVDAPAKNVAA